MESRTKNVLRNIIFGTASKIVTLLLPFLTRTMLLYLMGTISLGVSTLFTSILSFLSLAELGFGSAVVYTMYKPIAENDIESINALLNYYRRLYRIIGIIILAFGILLTPFLKYLIKGDTPEGVNLYILFYLYLFNSVVSYFFSGYRQSLLTAYQRTDIKEKIAIIITICVRICEIIAIYLTRNLYIYVLVTIAGTLCTNLITAIVTRRMFPEIECRGQIPIQTRLAIRNRLSGLFGTKLNSIVVNQADTIIISAFLGLTLLTQYGNYYYILNAVSGFVMMFFTSMTASIGNKIASDSIEEVYILFKKINFINNWIVGWCSICLLCLYHPFMLIWVKSDLTLPVLMSVLMTVYFYIYQIQRTLLTFKDAGGLWYEDRYRPYVSMTFNLISNLVLVQFIGIYGIVTSTIIAFFISLPWCNHVVFKNMFHMSSFYNLINMVFNFGITCVIGIITYFICLWFPVSIIGLIQRLIICVIFPNILYLIVFFKDDNFMYFFSLIKRLIRRVKT